MPISRRSCAIQYSKSYYRIDLPSTLRASSGKATSIISEVVELAGNDIKKVVILRLTEVKMGI